MNRIVPLLVAVIALPVFAGEDPKPVESRDLQSATEESKAEDSHDSRPVLREENRSVEGLSEKVLSNGISFVDLKGRFQHALVLRIDPDGTRSIECLDDPERVREAMQKRESTTASDESRED